MEYSAEYNLKNSLKYRAECEFDFGSESEIAFKSLLPEIDDSQRTSVSLSLSGSKIRLNLIASDLTSLRAALNTWLRLLRVARDMAKFKHT